MLGGRARGLAQLVEQARLHRARVEDRLEPPRGQLLDLLRRQIDAVALRDACLDVLDDLIDVGLVDLSWLLGLRLGLGRWRRPAVAPTVVTAPAAMEVLATSLNADADLLPCRSVSMAEIRRSSRPVQPPRPV